MFICLLMAEQVVACLRWGLRGLAVSLLPLRGAVRIRLELHCIAPEFLGRLHLSQFHSLNQCCIVVHCALLVTYRSGRLALFQIAYEAKNFCDSIIHNDGIIFLAHHLSTGLLSVRRNATTIGCDYRFDAHIVRVYTISCFDLWKYFALIPFLHIYGAYFLGISEISTAILCTLVCFDKDHGVEPLAKAFPTAMKVESIDQDFI
jgi:hypothetical protein